MKMKNIYSTVLMATVVTLMLGGMTVYAFGCESGLWNKEGKL